MGNFHLRICNTSSSYQRYIVTQELERFFIYDALLVRKNCFLILMI